MLAYRELLWRVLTTGEPKPSRAGATKFISHQTIMHNMQAGFPAITGRKLAFKTMAAELDCFIHGLTNIQDFHDRGCHIWDANLKSYNDRIGAPDNLDLGSIYGKVWRGADYKAIDQLAWVLAEARRDPSSRRLYVTAWIPEIALNPMLCALPPCHQNFQLTINDGKLDLCFYMRSVDLMLGLPFDIASYGLLQCLIANELDLTPNKLTGFLADAHIYAINFDAAKEYLAAKTYQLPKLKLLAEPGALVTDFSYDKAILENYQHGPAISTPMAI